MQANNTKERLLLSALELVSEKGSAATSVDEIAEKEHQLEMEYFPKVVEQVISETFGAM